jgi:hypothetical protein
MMDAHVICRMQWMACGGLVALNLIVKSYSRVWLRSGLSVATKGVAAGFVSFVACSAAGFEIAGGQIGVAKSLALH